MFKELVESSILIEAVAIAILLSALLYAFLLDKEVFWKMRNWNKLS